MNDMSDYFEIVESLLASRKQWEQVPQIVSLTFKAISHLLTQYRQSFQEHKTLINQQSLKIKQQQLRLGTKIGKKQFQTEMNNFVKNNQGSKKQQDNISQYQKLIKQSRYSRHANQKYDNITIQQLKTISQLIAQKKLSQFQKTLYQKSQQTKQKFDEKLLSLRQQLKNKFFDNQKQVRQLKQKISQYKSNWNKLQQSNIKLIHSISQQKINQLQNSNKVLSHNINQIINHIQNNYITKEQMDKIQKENKKNQGKQKAKTQNKDKHKDKEHSKAEKDRDQQIIKLIQNHINKLKQKQYKQWYQFKQNIHKQMSLNVKMQTITNLLDQFQKEILQKHEVLSNNIAKFERKINKNQQKHKQFLIKSQKRAQKSSSPNKNVQQIQQAIVKLQKTIIQKQKSQKISISQIVQDNIDKYDKKMMKQLDRRQKHLCQVIQQTYNHNLLKTNQNPTNIELKTSVKKLFQTNIFCRYLYHGLKETKKDGLIAWQQQIQNSIIQNFIWKKDSILINSHGVYKLQIALYGQIEEQAFILINDIKISTVKKPQLTKNTSIKIKGSYFSQILLLPNKSKLSIKVNQLFYGKGYLSIQKL